MKGRTGWQETHGGNNETNNRATDAKDGHGPHFCAKIVVSVGFELQRPIT